MDRVLEFRAACGFPSEATGDSSVHTLPIVNAPTSRALLSVSTRRSSGFRRLDPPSQMQSEWQLGGNASGCATRRGLSCYCLLKRAD